MVLQQRKGKMHAAASRQPSSASMGVEEAPDGASELEELREFKRQALSPIGLADTFNLQSAAGKKQLARQLWRGDYETSLQRVRAANPALVQIIKAQIANSYDRRASDDHRHSKDRQVDGILMCMIGAQSKFNASLITAGLAVLSHAHRVPAEFHEEVRRFFNGALKTETWTESVIKLARTLRPPPTDPLPGVAVAAFDNFSMQLNYRSMVVGGEGGQLKHMTNWVSCFIPAHLAPPTFDAHQLFANGIFRTGVSLGTFGRLFYLEHHEVAARRSHRFTRFMAAIRNGRHLSRPPVRPEWKPYKVYHDPIFDRLQSSYADVREEMRVISQACGSIPG